MIEKPCAKACGGSIEPGEEAYEWKGKLYCTKSCAIEAMEEAKELNRVVVFGWLVEK